MSRITNYTVYILRNDNNKLYIGQTSNLENRLKRHRSDGALFVRNDETYRLVYSESYQTQLESMRREKQLKGWSRAKKRRSYQEALNFLRNFSIIRL